VWAAWNAAADMWGEVTPAERLRAVTRRNVDEERLAIEAADALAGFASEPASLVVACRRVLAHHRSCGPLWWVCSRILAAPDPGAGAREASRLLDTDRTADRLGATLPLLDEDQVVAVIGWPEAFDLAMVERLDIAAVALRVEGANPASALRHRASDAGVRMVDPWDPALGDVVRFLVLASAIGPDSCLVPAGTTDALDTLGSAVREVWVIGGVGRVLPARLYDIVRDAALTPLSLDDDTAVEELAMARVDCIAGPRGVQRASEAALRTDCPVVPELLRPLD
jgi:hypothetical protein